MERGTAPVCLCHALQIYRQSRSPPLPVIATAWPLDFMRATPTRQEISFIDSRSRDGAMGAQVTPASFNTLGIYAGDTRRRDDDDARAGRWPLRPPSLTAAGPGKARGGGGRARAQGGAPGGARDAFRARAARWPPRHRRRASAAALVDSARRRHVVAVGDAFAEDANVITGFVAIVGDVSGRGRPCHSVGSCADAAGGHALISRRLARSGFQGATRATISLPSLLLRFVRAEKRAREGKGAGFHAQVRKTGRLHARLGFAHR